MSVATLPLLVALVVQVPVRGPCLVDDAGVPAVILGVGTQKVVTVNAPGSLRSLAPGVVDLKVLDPSHLLIIGQRAGTTRVFAEEDGGVRTWLVHVMPPIERDLYISELEKLFPCGSTLDQKTVGAQLFLDGEASSAEEWRAALTVAAKFRSVTVRGRLKSEVIDRGFLEAQAALRAAGFANVKWVRAGEVVLLEGAAPDEERSRLRALEAQWRPRLELLVSIPKSKDGGP